MSGREREIERRDKRGEECNIDKHEMMLGNNQDEVEECAADKHEVLKEDHEGEAEVSEES